MMLLELVDLEGWVHVVYCEQILPDLARVEDKGVLKQRGLCELPILLLVDILDV